MFSLCPFIKFWFLSRGHLISTVDCHSFVVCISEGEQEAAWLHEAGYGFLVSKIEGVYTLFAH